MVRKKKIGLYLLVFIQVLNFTACTSVKKYTFIQPVENFSSGEILFSANDIHVNIDYVKDSLIQSQICQAIDSKIKTYNSTCNKAGIGGNLVLKINQRTVWEGVKQRASFAITGEILNEGQEVLLQKTVLATGKASISQVKYQKKYIVSLVEELIEEWENLAPLEEE
ncbi:MAG: hypothetical protein IKK79_06265 [Spirochaetaceae bacterium]|nr:hypothetical protein [Spirochaetaceae bacterium]MBR6566396.1 hypothetical protein [Spirochaetaceae bacterium]